MTSKKKVILLGFGGHARVLLDALELNGVKVAGYCDLKPTSSAKLPYIGKDADLIKNFKPTQVLLVNGIGSVRLPLARQDVYVRFKRVGFNFAHVIHPSAVVSRGAALGEGVQVMAGAVIQTGAHIADNVIVNTSASVDHDCKIDAHTHICPGVTLSGDVHVGQGCHIGTGAKVIQGIQIGEGVLVGAGAIVFDHIPAQDVFLGSRSIKRRVEGKRHV